MSKRPAVPVVAPEAVDRLELIALAQAALAARITEVESDLKRLADLLGAQFGEPLASHAKDIAYGKQGV